MRERPSYDELWKFPLFMHNNKVYSQNRIEAFEFVSGALSIEERENIVSCINGEVKYRTKETFRYIFGSVYMGPKEIIHMKGWSYLIGVRGMDEFQALSIQEELAESIIINLNLGKK